MTSDENFLNDMTHKTNSQTNPLYENSQCHPIAFFFQKIILIKTRYKTHDEELLAIIEVFMTWHHYIKSCIYKVFVLTDHNNLY